MGSEDKLRIMKYGILGTGRIAPVYLQLARHFPALECLAVAGRDPENARDFARRYGIEAVAVDELLNRDDISTIVNLTPIPAHDETSRAIVNSGKNLYSEKPLTASLANGRALLEQAREKGVAVAAAPDTFLGSAAQRARALVDAGEIGRPVAASAHFMMDGRVFGRAFFDGAIGPLRELGPYYITALVHLLGPIQRVAATARNVMPHRAVADAQAPVPIEVATTISALLTFVSGAEATLTVSVDVMDHRHSPLEIYGTEGSLILPDPNFFGGNVVRLGREGQTKVYATEADMLGRPNWEGGTLANYRSVGLADFAAALLEGREPRCSADLALHVSEVIAAILDGAERHQFVAMETRCDRPRPLGLDASALGFESF